MEGERAFSPVMRHSTSPVEEPITKDEGRKTLCNQRAMLEKLKFQFSAVHSNTEASGSDSQSPIKGRPTESIEQLQIDVRRLNQETAKQRMNLLHFKVEKEDYSQERQDLLERNSKLKADVEDLEQRFSMVQAELARLKEHKLSAAARCAELEAQAFDFKAADVLRWGYNEHCISYDELSANARSALGLAKADVKQLLHERRDKEAELKEIKSQLCNMNSLFEEVLKSHVPLEDLQTWKRRAEEIEDNMRQLVSAREGDAIRDATRRAEHMSRSASERERDVSELQEKYDNFKKESSRKDHELQMAELQRQDLQKELQQARSSLECLRTTANDQYTQRVSIERGTLLERNSKLKADLQNAELEKQDLQSQLRSGGDWRRSAEHFQLKCEELQIKAAAALQKSKEAEAAASLEKARETDALRGEIASLTLLLAEARRQSGLDRILAPVHNMFARDMDGGR